MDQLKAGNMEESFSLIKILNHLVGPRRTFETYHDLRRLIRVLECTDEKQWQGNAKQNWIEKALKLGTYINQGHSLMPVIGCTGGKLTEHCVNFLIINNSLFRPDQSFRVPGEPMQICLTELYGLMSVVVTDGSILHVIRGSRAVLHVRLSEDSALFSLSPNGDTFVIAHCLKNSDIRNYLRIFYIDEELNVTETSIGTKCAASITSFAISKESSHIVFGSEQGNVGISDGKIVTKKRRIQSKVNKITTTNSWIVILSEDGVSVFTWRLEHLATYCITQMVYLSVSHDEHWIACGGRSGVVLLSTRSNSRQVKKQFDSGIIDVDINSEYIVWCSKDGSISASHIKDFEKDDIEPRFMIKRIDSSACSIAFAQGSHFFGWKDGMILSMKMTTQNSLQLVTPSIDEVAKHDQLMFEVDAKPVTDKQRQVALQILFGGGKVPPYNFDSIVRLFFACVRRSKELGSPDWTPEQSEFLELIKQLCISVAKKEHAGSVPFLIQAVEAQLRIFYMLM